MVLCTSLAAIVVARSRRGNEWTNALRSAVARALDCLGWLAIFLLANILVGAVLILGFRGVTGHFVSVYELADVTLVFLSLLQALVADGFLRRPS